MILKNFSLFGVVQWKRSAAKVFVVTPYTFTVTATDAAGNSASVTYTITLFT